MTVVDAAANLLKREKIKGIDNIYSFFVPESKQANSDQTDLLITHVIATPNDFGSNQINSQLDYVAVKIFKGKKAATALDEMVTAIVRIFEKDNWQVRNLGSIVIDPTSYQKTQELQFTKRRLF